MHGSEGEVGVVTLLSTLTLQRCETEPEGDWGSGCKAMVSPTLNALINKFNKKFNLVNEVKLKSREGIPRLKTDVETV
jgi:hypothetical protein